MSLQIIKLSLSVILIVFIVILIKKYIKEYKIYDVSKEQLFDFFSEKNEYEALKKLGAINPFGEREKWHVSSRKIREYLTTREDLQTEDRIKEFLKQLDRFEKAYMSYFMLSLLFIFIIFILQTD